MTTSTSWPELRMRFGQSLAARMVRSDLAHPVLVRAVGELLDPGARSFFSRRLLEPYEAARRVALKEGGAAPTLGEFFQAASEEVQAFGRALLGEQGYELVTLSGGRSYLAAWEAVVHSFREAIPPLPFGPSWSHWERWPVAIEAFEEREWPRVLPVDHPVLRIRREAGGAQVVEVGYPDWSTGRKRLFVNTAHIQYARLVGKDLPLDLDGAALRDWARANDPHLHDLALVSFDAHPDLRLTRTQIVQLRSSGRSPAVESRFLAPGAARPKGFREGRLRNADDARWELARRLDDSRFVDERTFEEAVLAHPGALSTTSPTVSLPRHPVTTLAPQDLVALARGQPLPDGRAIVTMAFEVEHRRAQRSVRTLERMFVALGQEVDPDRLRHLCGLCDPNNLQIVTPYEHASVDGWAAMLGGGQRRRLNGARTGAADPLDDWVPRSVIMAPGDPPEDLVPPGFVENWDEHFDAPRTANVWFGFTPRELAPVLELLVRVNVRELLPAFDAAHRARVTETWNHFAGNLNAAVRSYQLNRRYLLDATVGIRPPFSPNAPTLPRRRTRGAR